MNKALQTYEYPLKSFSYVAGGNDVVNFDAVPRRIFGRVAHLVGVMFDWYSEPALTTAPTTQLQHNSVLSNITFNDGQLERFNGSLHDMRTFELLESGRIAIPEPDAAANGAGIGIRKFLPVGPYGVMAGGHSDFLLPIASLGGAEVRFTYGGLTSFSADTTAQNNSNLRITAVLAALDKELRVPPHFERRIIQSAANEVEIKGKSLLHSLGLVKSTSYTAWSAGDLAELSIDTGNGSTPNIHASTRAAMAHLNMIHGGGLSSLRGEPRAATDDNASEKNLAGPTALVAALANIQSVLTNPDGARISKMLYEVQNSAKVKWTGTYSTAPRLFVSRLLSQPKTVIGTIASKAIDELKMGVPSGGVVKTLSKRPYKGPREEYLPHYFKWA